MFWNGKKFEEESVRVGYVCGFWRSETANYVYLLEKHVHEKNCKNTYNQTLRVTCGRY